MIGRTLAHYEITDALGAGGMGEVYRARDTVLGRDVALKLLPPGAEIDPEALARFEREARLLASVAHPAIATIHGLHEEDGVRCIAMEYLGGGTLAELLAEQSLDLASTLPIARDVASALEAAHACGVVHRDVKPSNIAFDEKRRPKLLDFGIGRNLESARLTEPGATTLREDSLLTRAGASLGTPAYMSPEQIRGEPVDTRTDVWSFGVVLYEMLSGSRPFGTGTASEIFARALETDVDLGALPASLPRELRQLVRRCLVRDREQRLQSIGDARVVIEELLRGETLDLEDPASGSGRGPSRRLWLLLVPLAALAGWWLRPVGDAPAPGAERFTVELPDSLRLVHNYQRGLALSHDGRTLVFVAGTSDNALNPHGGSTTLYARRLGEWESWKIPGTEGATLPVFSPDDEWIAFDQDRQLKKMRLSGGEVQIIADHHAHLGMDWGDDDRLVFAGVGAGIGIVPLSGGVVDTLVLPDWSVGERTARLPRWSADSRFILFTTMDSATQLEYAYDSRIRAYSLGTGEVHTVVENGSDAHDLGDGRLVFAREGSLFVVEVDPHSMLPNSEPRLALENVVHAVHAASFRRETAVAQYDVARNGTLAYAYGSVFPERKREVVWLDQDGRETRIDVPLRQYGYAQLSPDESSLLLTPHYAPYDVQVYDFARSTLRRQTFEGYTWAAIWGPGQRSITLTGTRRGEYVCLVQGLDTPDEDPVAIDLPERIWAMQWDASGDTLLCWTWDGDLAYLDADNTLIRITESETRESGVRLSPDGRWIVYESSESGEPQIYVRSFPHGRRTYQVSVDGGMSPLWARDGSAVHYWGIDDSSEESEDVLMAVSFRSDASRPVIGHPRALCRKDVLLVGGDVNYSVASDGRFVIVKSVSDSTRGALTGAVYPDRIRVATEWAQGIGR